MRHAQLVAFLISGGLCTATGALAQGAPAKESAPQEVAQAGAARQASTDVQPTTPAPATPSTTAPAAAAPAAVTAPPPTGIAVPGTNDLVRIYGIVITRFVASTSAVESYGQPNAVAITAAGNPILSNSPDNARYTFQAAQSRFGLWVNERGAVRGQLEFDFVDFAKASPTVASLPRLRIAKAEWAIGGGHSVALGQDWDLYAPVNPHGINMVGALFQAGNSGFMRQQLKYFYADDNFEVGAAVGFPAVNAGAKDSAFEISTLPTLAARAAYKFGKSRVGVSAITTELPFNIATDNERRTRAVAMALYSDLNPLPTTNVRVELNYGQDGANIGLLTIAQGNTAGDVQEAGGFVSVRQALAADHALYGMVGTQRVLNPAALVPSYAYPAGTTGTPAPGTATSAGTGPGIVYNNAARLGYEYKPLPSVSIVFEGFLYQTRHYLQALDTARATSGVRRALGVETGAMLTF